LNVGKKNFRNRVVNEWNALNEEIIQSKSLTGLKRLIIIWDSSSGDLYKLPRASFLFIVEYIFNEISDVQVQVLY